jgi:transposase
VTIEIRNQLEAHPDGQTFRSLFIDPTSWHSAATMLAEIGDCRERYPDYRALAADAGRCPVAVESGKARHAKFRWACDRRLRHFFDHLADASRHHNPWANDHLHPRTRPRSRTRPRHPRPRTSLSQVIWKLWQEQGTYRHAALQRLIAAKG